MRVLTMVFLLSLAGCASTPSRIRFYPASTDAEHEQGYGPVQEIEYSRWNIRLFCKSIF